jgi:hypothetical protein
MNSPTQANPTTARKISQTGPLIASGMTTVAMTAKPARAA